MIKTLDLAVAATLAACLTCGVMLSPAAAAEGVNLLLNSGFESDANHDNKADYWLTYPDVMAKSTALLAQRVSNASDAAEGRCYLHLSREQGTGPLSHTQILSDTALKQIRNDLEKSLVLRGKIRASAANNSKALLNVQFFVRVGESGQKFAGQIATPALSGNENWEEVTVAFKPADIIPPNAELKYMEVNLLLPSIHGSADFDDISLTFE